MRLLLIFAFFLSLASCTGSNCSTCHVKGEAKRIRTIKKQAIKMEKEMNRRAKG